MQTSALNRKHHFHWGSKSKDYEYVPLGQKTTLDSVLESDLVDNILGNDTKEVQHITLFILVGIIALMFVPIVLLILKD